MGKKIRDFIKRETVLDISFLLALGSCFLIHPDKQYAGYIDTGTLIVLFCLMAVVAGMKELGMFQRIGEALLERIQSERGLVLVLVFLCFFSSMLITNDVALITFVPLALLILHMTDRTSAVCFVVTLMTIGANLGSMLTPVGNPQNLYLYSVSGMTLGAFLRLMLPYTLISAGVLLVCIFLGYRKRASISYSSENTEIKDRKRLAVYLILFGICLLSVAGVISRPVLLVLITAGIFFADRKLFGKVDYSLLATFVCFFIFIGNMGRFPVFRRLIGEILEGHVRLAAAAISQIISNVPAALLLAGFTEEWKELIVGTNLGGLGTLIASMASLISYKQIAVKNPGLKSRYLAVFTLLNVIFLMIFAGVSLVL
ncbi:MAG: SLC13 family permease [Blautia sp.]